MRGVYGAWPRWTGFCVAVVCVAVVCALGSTALGQAQVPPSGGGVVTPPATRQSASAATAPVAPADAQRSWRAGGEAFGRGQFAQAVELYLRAMGEQGGRSSADGHYNLATAYYRLGRMGEAILHFEKALKRSPRMDDAKHNLAIARRTLELDKAMQEMAIPVEGFWKRFGRAFTAGEAALVFLILYYLFFGVVIARRFFEGTARAALTVAAIVTVVFAMSSGGLFAYRLYASERVREGIILEKTALMEPQRGEWKSLRALPQGLRVRVESRNESWVKVRVPNGLVGFVKHAQLGEI